MKRNIFSIKKLATICLCLFAFVGQGFAAWDGSTRTQPTTTTIDGKTYYVIANEANLAWFANRVNSSNTYASINAILTADLDMGNKAFTPIGYYASNNRVYSGIFDGQGYSISGLYVTSNSYAGLFGRTSSNAVIKNVTVTHSTFKRVDYMSGGTGYGGAIVAYNGGGTISGCIADSVYVQGAGNNSRQASHSGGIVGYNTGTIEMCTVARAYTEATTDVGGVAGYNSGTIKNCLAESDVKSVAQNADGYAGGIAGDNRGTVTRCVYTGDSVVPGASAGEAGGGAITGHAGTGAQSSDNYYTEDGLRADGKDISESDIEKIKEALGDPWDVADEDLIINNGVNYFWVIIEPNGHGSKDSLSVKKNAAIGKLDSIVVDGYKRVGLCKDASCSQTWNVATGKVTEKTTLYTKWQQAYKVTFAIGSAGLNDGGKFPAGATTSKYFVQGEKITATGITAPTFDNGELDGWTTDPTGEPGTAMSDLGTMGTTPITLYAVEKSAAFVTITYNKGTASGAAGETVTQKVISGKTATLKNNLFTRVDGYNTYAQTGWTTTPNGGGTKIEFGASVTVNSNVTYYPYWDRSNYAITYKFSASSATDGNGKSIATAYKVKNVEFHLSEETFSKPGYKQDGWSTQSDGSVKSYGLGASYTQNAAITLYPHWVVDAHNAIFNANGGKFAGNKDTLMFSIVVDNEISFTGTAPTKVGYNFLGWATSQTAPEPDDNLGLMGDKDKTFYAVWAEAKYAVIYKYTIDGGTNYTIAGDVDSVTAGTANVAVRSNYMKDGYNMTAWATEDATVSGGAFTMPTKDVVFTSTGTVAEYTITYHLDNGTNAASNPSVYTILTENITLAAATKNGYDFGGWYDNAGFSGDAVTQIAKGSFGNKDLYAKWNVKTYNITYAGIDGATNPNTVATYTVETDDISLAAASKTGYTFDGWYDGENKIEKIAKGSTGDKTLTAHWTANNYTATFNANGGEFGEGVTTATKQVAYDAAITATDITEPTREGYAFKGWALTSDASAAAENLGTMNSTEGVTIYAVWLVKSFTITLEPNGGTLGTGASPITQEYGTTIQTRAAPTKTGYTFAGWFENEELSGDAVTIPATMPAKTYTLYAKWTPAEVNYTVKTCTMETDGTYDESKCSSETKTGFTESTADATPESFDTGFELDTENSTLTGTVAADGSLALGVYIKRITYTMTFDTKGGNTIDPISGLFGAALVAPANPEKTGYTFSKWDSEIPTTIPAENKTFNAVWLENVEVTITGHSSSSTYTGSEQTVEGYDVAIPEGSTYTADKIQFNGTASVSKTDVGTYAMGLKSTDFANTDDGYVVTFTVTDGSLTIGKKAVSFKGKAATETYTGSLISNAEFTVEGLVSGHTHNVVAKAEGTEASATAYAGTITDAASVVIEDASGNDVTANYEITTTAGSLTIEKAAGLTVALDGATFTYDAQAHALSTAATTNAVSGTTVVEYSFDKSVWVSDLASLTKVAAGTYTVNVRATNPNYSNTATGSATLSINQAAITVNVTGSSSSVKYDGEEHSVSGYTATSESGLFNAGKVQFSGTAEAKQTTVGTTNMGLTAAMFSYDDANITATFEITDGYQTISEADEVVVTITGHKSTVNYNGGIQEVTGYDFSADNALYTTSDFEFTGTAKASGMVTGTYDMGLAVANFSNKNANFSKVTFKVTDGQLTINPIVTPIVITAASDEKVYNGTALTNSTFTYTEGVVLTGDVLSATVEGTITDAGSADNVVKSYKVMNGTTDVTSCYTFGESVKGTLTVNKATLNVKTESASRAYNGEALTAGASIVSGLVGSETATIAATGSQTIVGSTDNTYEITWGTAKESNYTVSATVGTLEVTAATITITAEDQFYTYNGNAQGVAATTDVAGTTISYCDAEGENCSATVPQLTDADTVTVTVKATKTNYSDAEKTYQLGVAKKAIEVTVSGKNASATYDGTDHLVEGFDATTEETLYDVANVALVDGKLASATTKNVDKVMMGLTKDSFVNNDNNFTATFTVTDGYSEVTAREVTLSWTPASFVYDGNSHVPTATAGNVVDGETVTVTVDASGAKTDVGEGYVATATALSSTNYKLPEAKTTMFSITPATLTIAGVDYENVYDGANHGDAAVVKYGETVVTGATVEYSTDNGTTWSATVPTIKDVGSKTVKVRANKTNFAQAEDDYTLAVTAREVTLSWDLTTFVYNGDAHLPAATAGNVVDGETVTVTVDASGAKTDAGTGYVATATGLSSTNYKLPEANTTMFSISKRAVTFTGKTDTKTFTGSEIELTEVTAEGLVDGHTHNVTYSAKGTAADEYIGTITAVADVKIMNGMTDVTANYDITTTAGKLTIAAAEKFTIALESDEGYIYDGAAHHNTKTATSDAAIGTTTFQYQFDGDGETWVSDLTSLAKTDAGSYTINVKATNPNYSEAATTTAKLTIAKRAITLTSASDSKFYDGTALTANTVTVTEGSYANDESFQYNVTGSQIEVGASENTFTYSATSSAKVENYEVTLVKGTLTVHPVVTFVMNGHGTQVAKQEVLTGEKATEPTEPSEEGYTFGGWFTDNETFENAYDFDAAVNANMTLYAKWTVNKYMVTFVDEDGETVLASKDYDYGTAVADIEIPETPTKAEDNTYTYAFANWSPELAAVTGIATYTATYTPTYKNYHVAFKTDANVVLIDKEDFHYGDALEAPSNPTREATDEYTYEFDKWDPAVPATVEGSQTYIAKFTPVPNKYTLTWDTDGGTITSAEDAYTAAGQVAYGTELVAPVVTKGGFTFTGWTPEVSTMPAENITFKALWTEQLVVSFNVQGHGTAPESQLLDPNEKAVEPTAPTAQNYIFGGWFKDAACTQPWNFDDVVTASMELFAKWTGAFSLTFTLDGVDIETRSAVSEGTVITVLDSAAKDGHDFAGWVMETEGVTFEAVTGGHKFVMPAKAVNISGAYKYFVKYKLDGAQVGEETYTYGTEVTVREPETKTGYDISDWTSSVTITDGKFAMPAADVELTATSTIQKFTVTYKVTGSYFANDAFDVTKNVAYGTKLSLITTDMTKEGYTFRNWELVEGDIPIYIHSGDKYIIMGVKDVVFEGSYTLNHHTVTWKNGEEIFSSSSADYNTKVSAPVTAPTKDGYKFTGWTTNDATLADDYSFTMPDNAVTLNADWDLETYEIAYETNGGEAVSSSSYTIESADVTLPTPTRTGYEFRGWFDNEGLSGTAVTKVAAGSFGNKTFYAKWSVVTYNITYSGLGDMTHENPATYTVEDAIVLANPSDSTGYSFNGWYIGEDEVTGIAKGSTGAKTIVAKWSPKNVNFKIVYKLYSPTGVVEKTMVERTYLVPADADINRYILWENFGAGYSYDLVYINGVERNKSHITEKIARDGSTVVEVRVEHNEFTFTFYTEGESGWEQWNAQPRFYGYDVETVNVKAPTAPTKTGYTLVGWCADAETCESVQTFPMNVPAKNMNFYPKWTINQYTITFDTKGGSAIDAITQDYNTAVTAPEDPTRAGYLFAGWDKEIPATMPAENITITASWNMDVQATSYEGVYDGNAHGITVTAPEGATVTYSDAENGTYVAALTYADVGEYTVYYKASQEGYTDVKGSATVTITPATMTLVVAGYAGTYDGDAHSGTATPSVTEGTTVSYSVDNGITWTTDVPTFTNADTVVVKVKAENSNYQTVEDNYTIAIAKKVIAVAVSGKNASATYDGTDHLVEGFDATTEETLYDVANVALVDGKLATATTKNVAKVMMGLTEDSFVNNDNNFTVTFAVTDGYSEVTAREVTLSWDPTTFVYDGNSHIPTATAGNVVTGETVTVTVDASGAKIDVGTDYVATATGLSSTNYKLPATVTTTFNITPATITITAIDQWYTYTGLTQQATAAKTDVAGATITYSVDDGMTWSATVPSLTDADTVAVTVKAEKANYTTATKEFSFGVAQANINDVTVAIDDWTYGETAKTPTTSATFKAADEPVVTYSVKGADSWSTTVPTDAGEYTVKAAVAETANYVGGEATQDFEILPATMTLVVAGYTGTYDGDAHSGTATPSVTAGTTVSYSVDNGTTWTTDVPIFTDADTVVVKVKTVNSNYQMVEDNYAVAIAKRAVKLTSGSAQKFYDGMALTNDGITVDGSFANGETPKYTFTGSQTEAGSSANVFSVSMEEPASNDNYDFTLNYGTLTVDPVVTFVMNGHGTQVDKQEVLTGEKATAPEAPSETGYTFDGWFTDDGSFASAYDFNSAVTANTTLYAKWTAIVYDIAYFLNGGKDDLSNPASYTIETETITLVAPKRTGYDFKGWYGNRLFDGDVIKTIPKGSTGKVNLYAKWTPATYVIKFHSNGGPDVPDLAAGYETEISIPTPEWEGYTFEGWFTDDVDFQNKFESTTMPLHGAHLYAKWTAIVYDIAYFLNGGKDDLSNPASYTIETETITLVAPKRTGYDFKGWYGNRLFDGDVIKTIPKGSTGKVNLYAKWTPATYVIKFHSNGGPAVPDLAAGYETEISVPTPEWEGYTFEGWFTDDVDFQNKFESTTMPLHGAHLYAKWTVNQYTITFDTKGGSEVAPITQNYGTAVTAPENPTRTDYLFAGWDKEIPATMPAENLTITASWNMDVQATGYTGVYDGNAHGITVTAPEGATVTYSDAENGTYVATLTYADVGEYTVYYKASQEGYADVKGSATVTITPATMTLVVAGYTGTYDGDAHSGTVTPSITIGTTVSYSIDNGTTWTTDVPTFTDADTVVVKVKAVNSNYQMVEDKYTVAIEKKAVTVAANDNQKVLGTADPTFTATVTGTIGDDKVEYTLARATGETAGTYTITASGDAIQGNYTVSFTNGVFTISPVVTVVLADSVQLVCTEGATGAENCTEDGKSIDHTYGEETSPLPGAVIVNTTTGVVDTAWHFQGWFENEDGIKPEVTKVDADETDPVVIYPFFKKTIEVVIGDSTTIPVVIDNNDTKDSIENKVKEAAENSNPPIKPNPETYVKEPYEYTYSGEYECELKEDKYLCEAIFDSTAITYDVVINLPDSIKLDCTNSNGCMVDPKTGDTTITHKYGEETILPGANVVDTETGKVDSTWEFQGWFDNEDGRGDTIKTIGADVYGDTTIYPFFTKELKVEIADTIITVVIDNNDSKDSVDNKVTDAIRDAGIEDPTKPADSKYSYEFEKYEYDMETGKVTPVFKPTGREYKIVYMMPKAAALSKEIKTYTYGVGTVLPTASIKGDKDWMFMGWYADEGFIGERTKEITKKDVGKKVLYPMFQKDLRYSTRDESGVISVLYDEDVVNAIERTLAGVRPADYDESGVTYTFSKWVEKNGVYTAEYTEKTGINHRAIANFHVMVSGRTLEISGAKMGAKIAVFDMSGRMVAQGIVENGTTRVDLAKAGSYVVRVNNQVSRVNVR